MRAIYGFAAGTAFGAALAAGLAPYGPAPVPPPAPAPAPVVRQTDALTAEKDTGRRVGPPVVAPILPATCEELLASRTLELGVLKRQLASYGGVAAEWPHDVAAPYRPDAMRAWLDEAVRGVPVSVEALDCDEYPCLAVVRYADGQPTKSTVVQPVLDAFVAHTQGAAHTNVSLVGTPSASYAVLAMFPPDLSPDVEQRLSVRSDEIIGELAER